MHSSRMRTGRSWTVCWSQHPGGGGGVCLVPGGGCLPHPGGEGEGGVCQVPGGGRVGVCQVPGEGGVCQVPGKGGVCHVPGGVCLVLGGCLPGPRGGVCQVRGDMTSQHALRQTPSPPPTVDRQTPVKTLPWPQLRCGR